MPEDYQLNICTQQQPADLLSMLAPLADLTFKPPDHLFFQDELAARIHPSSLLSQDLTEEQFGFRPTYRMWFPTKTAIPDITDVVLRCAFVLLHMTKDPLVLLFNGEFPILLRAPDQRIILNRLCDYWNTARGCCRLDTVDFPYELQDMPVV